MGQHLEDRATGPEQGPEEHRRDRRGKTPLKHDHAGERLLAGQGLEDLAEGQRIVADEQAGSRQRHRQQDQEDLQHCRPHRNADAEAGAAQAQHVVCESHLLRHGFAFHACVTSSGAPMTAVRMPTSISPGAAITRPSESAISTRAGAARREPVRISR